MHSSNPWDHLSRKLIEYGQEVGTRKWQDVWWDLGMQWSNMNLLGANLCFQKHGIINAVSWGILLPIGVMVARYLRPFAFADPVWLYIHITFQITGYILGVVGWGMGLQLQKYANPIQYRHRNLGVAIFTLATLQVHSFVPSTHSQFRKSTIKSRSLK